MKKYYSLTTFLVFGIFSILTTFYFPYLNQEIGLSFSTVSSIVSIGALFTLVSQPLIVHMLSKSKNERKFILSYLALVFIGIIGLSLINKNLTIIFAPIYGSFLAPIGGIFEVYIEDLTIKHKLEFSDIRKWGSIGYGCIVLIGGGIVSNFGYRILHILALLMIIIISLTVYFKFDTVKHKEINNNKISTFTLIKNKNILFLAIIIILGIGSYMGIDFAYSSYLLDITGDSTKANAIYSASVGVRVFIEFFAFMFVAKYLRNANSKKCLILSFVVAATKMLLFSTKILPLVVLGDQLHGIMFSLYLTFLFKYLREILDSTIVPNAFALLSVLSSGGANFIFPSIYGFIQTKFGYSSMYFLGFSLIVIAIILSLTILPKGNKISSQKESLSVAN